MWGKWGRAWLAALVVMVSLTCASAPGLAGDTWEQGGMPLALTAAQTPMEAQMLGEKPFHSSFPPSSLFPGALSGLQLEEDGGAIVKLPLHLEMRISVLYNREPTPIEPQKLSDSRLMNYSLDYCFLPNLRVGLNAYLYRADAADNPLTRQFSGRAMGLGPGIKYDLGHWSFLLKSQMETGSQRNDLQNWFRVWYAF
jgi:hypothetical protein